MKVGSKLGESWEKKRITVITKAYPEQSKKYGSVACTADITEDAEWIRLYPADMKHFSGKDKILSEKRVWAC